MENLLKITTKAVDVTVLDSWRDSFEAFLNDMGEKPKGYRFNRIDKEGDFEPDNCEWVPIRRKANER